MQWRIPPYTYHKYKHSKAIEPALRRANAGDTVEISDEAKRKFQEMCEYEIENRKWKKDGVRVINVDIDESPTKKGEVEDDIFFFFLLGSAATLILGVIGYALGTLLL